MTIESLPSEDVNLNADATPTRLQRLKYLEHSSFPERYSFLFGSTLVSSCADETSFFLQLVQQTTSGVLTTWCWRGILALPGHTSLPIAL